MTFELLHTHTKLEQDLKLDIDHVIVDRKDREIILAENKQLKAEIDSVKKLHNGYDPEARKVMPTLKEPTSLIQAVRELMGESEELGKLELKFLRAHGLSK